MQREFDDKLAQQAQSADVGQKNWLTNAQHALEERERMLNSQWSNFEQQLKKREEEWKLERDAMATVKAEVKFKSSSKLRESHIRRFIMKLRNDQLKTALEGHRFQSIADLERALRRHGDVWREEGYDAPAPKKPRDFRSDNVHQGRPQNRGPTKCQGRAFMTQGDTEPMQDSEFQPGSQGPDWKAFQSVMTLAKQGNASELPTQFRSLLQTKDHASGAQQLNQ
ncbi:hypothetical protein PHMEG_00029143 [Phytophthora megakarya]|uniref:Uncharacterized protein n=1 Tax=Phytophthora megakarya TaxID=4795 RepID=A0A225V508_9STRA|nr:hypothetical protein PHMEG_00029143 [Phytophthora megakarya]